MATSREIERITSLDDTLESLSEGTDQKPIVRHIARLEDSQIPGLDTAWLLDEFFRNPVSSVRRT